MTSLAGSFQFPGVADAYVHRPPYPSDVIDLLVDLADQREVLDIGAGDGALARPLAVRVDRVDAVEISPAMVERGRRRPGGDRENLVWRIEAAETTGVAGPYALVTAGASLHWMDAQRVFDRVARVLAPNGVLAIVDQGYHQVPWAEAVSEIIARHSRNPAYNPKFSLSDDLVGRRLWEVRGQYESRPMAWRQSVADYVEQFHSTASLPRELLGPAEADTFDQEVAAAVKDFADADGLLHMHTMAWVTWGRPLAVR